MSIRGEAAKIHHTAQTVRTITDAIIEDMAGQPVSLETWKAIRALQERTVKLERCANKLIAEVTTWR